MWWKRLATNFDPMIQPSATLATILPPTVDVFDFHGFTSFRFPSLTSQSRSLLMSMRLSKSKPQKLHGRSNCRFHAMPAGWRMNREIPSDDVSRQDTHA
jgi:hypothetical protein